MERANVGHQFKYIRFSLIHLNLHSLFIVAINRLFNVSGQTTTGPDCITNCEGKDKGNYQSCKGCDVYVMCKAKGFMKDNVPCGQENGQQKYWNTEEGKCTVNNSTVCKLEAVENEDPPQPHQPG